MILFLIICIHIILSSRYSGILLGCIFNWTLDSCCNTFIFSMINEPYSAVTPIYGRYIFRAAHLTCIRICECQIDAPHGVRISESSDTVPFCVNTTSNKKCWNAKEEYNSKYPYSGMYQVFHCAFNQKKYFIE